MARPTKASQRKLEQETSGARAEVNRTNGTSPSSPGPLLIGGPDSSEGSRTTEAPGPGPESNPPNALTAKTASVTQDIPEAEEARRKKRESNAAYRARKAGRPPANAQPSAPSPEAFKASQTFVTMFESMAAILIGPDAVFNPTERALVSEALPQLLNDLTPEMMTAVNRVTYPAMLTIGLGAWGLRVFLTPRPGGNDSSGGGGFTPPDDLPPSNPAPVKPEEVDQAPRGHNVSDGQPDQRTILADFVRSM